MGAPAPQSRPAVQSFLEFSNICPYFDRFTQFFLISFGVQTFVGGKFSPLLSLHEDGRPAHVLGKMIMIFSNSCQHVQET
jgi:hypothetical protein